MSRLAGTWVQTKGDNLEAYFQKNGLNYVMRKLAAKASLSMKIEIDGDNLIMAINSSIKSWVNNFIIGGETEGVIQDVKVTLRPRWEGEKLVVEAEPIDEKATLPRQTITRELVSDDELLMTTDNGAISKRWFKRQ